MVGLAALLNVPDADFPAQVTVARLEEETDEEHTFQIVGEDEADIKQGLISISSRLVLPAVERLGE